MFNSYSVQGHATSFHLLYCFFLLNGQTGILAKLLSLQTNFKRKCKTSNKAKQTCTALNSLYSTMIVFYGRRLGTIIYFFIFLVLSMPNAPQIDVKHGFV